MTTNIEGTQQEGEDSKYPEGILVDMEEPPDGNAEVNTTNNLTGVLTPIPIPDKNKNKRSIGGKREPNHYKQGERTDRIENKLPIR